MVHILALYLMQKIGTERMSILTDLQHNLFSIVGLALVKLQLGYVEHYSVRIQHPANNERARPRVIPLKT